MKEIIIAYGKIVIFYKTNSVLADSEIDKFK